MQTDLSDGVRHLVSQGIVDPKRVSILGASYGGYAALAGATIDTGVYNCAVSIAGISDVRRMVNSDAEYSAEGRSSQMVLQTRRYLGEAGDYDDISPAQQAKNATIPILLLHGKDDSVVPFEQSEFMASALKNAGKAYEFVALDGQDHWESKESGRIEMMTRALSFLEKYNPPKP